MHINLIPRLQGRGIGRRLIETITSSLRNHGSPGLHLLVGFSNKKAAGFYRHVGFTEFPAASLNIFIMDLTTETP
jgi:ribosomal protein S18 acetylase RimI-like enzyme